LEEGTEAGGNAGFGEPSPKYLYYDKDGCSAMIQFLAFDNYNFPKSASDQSKNVGACRV